MQKEKVIKKALVLAASKKDAANIMNLSKLRTVMPSGLVIPTNGLSGLQAPIDPILEMRRRAILGKTI